MLPLALTISRGQASPGEMGELSGAESEGMLCNFEGLSAEFPFNVKSRLVSALMRAAVLSEKSTRQSL